tara:strand:+ start:1725 stop:2039 length:315 start_codon:yes stop_codon:yes gene_type:complete
MKGNELMERQEFEALAREKIKIRDAVLSVIGPTTAHEAARFYGVDRRTVYRVLDGEVVGRPFEKGGRKPKGLSAVQVQELLSADMRLRTPTEYAEAIAKALSVL